MKLREISFIEFDEFSNNHPLGSFYQSSNYALIMAEKGFDYDYIGMFDNDNELVAASLLLFKNIKRDIKYGYAPKGFLIDYHNERLVSEFTSLLIDYYDNKNVAFIKVNPEIIVNQINDKDNTYNTNKNIVYTLESNKYLKLKNNLYFESMLPRFNGIVNLEKFSYSSLKKNARNKINKSIRKGLVLEKGDINSLSIIEKMIKKNKSFCDINLYDYYNVFNKTDNVDIFLVKIDYEEFLINSRICYDKEIERNNELNSNIIKYPTEDNINKKMNSDLIILSYKNDIMEGTKGLKEEKNEYIAGALVVKHNDTITIISSTYDVSYSRHNPNYFLYFEIMNYYKDQYKYCDLNGMTGDFSNSNPYYGLNKFKMSFNPDIYEYIGEHDLIINSNLYTYLKESGSLVKEFNKKI